MKFFVVCFLLAVAVCAAQRSDDKIEEFLRKLLSRTKERDQRILSRSSDDAIQGNHYMPEGLKKLIDEQIVDMPEDPGSTRIFGGSVAPKKAYPYQVGLSLSFGAGQTSWCGGSIISQYFIVSAAHCFDRVVTATVYAGAHDRLNSYESGRIEMIVSRKNFIVHRGWDPSSMSNDIALVRLDRPLTFSSQIKAVILPSEEFENIDGQTGTISGWGHYDTTKQLSRYLRYAKSQIINLSYCRQIFSNYIRSSNVCLDGSRGQGTCNGDSGGPLVVTSSAGESVLVGLTSFGSGQGCQYNMPTVYTRITSYLQWIKQNARI